MHGNTTKHALSYASTEYVIRFLLTYAEQHALLLPGRIRIPGYSHSDIQLLLSSVSKLSVWQVYHEAVEAIDAVNAVAYTTFCLLWRTLIPYMKAMSGNVSRIAQQSCVVLMVQRVRRHPSLVRLLNIYAL